MTCLRVDLLEFILFEVLYDSYNWICVFFFRFRKFSTIILSNTFSNFSLSSPSGIPRTWMLVHLILSQRSLNCSFCFVFHLGVLLGVLHFSIFQTIYVFSYEAGRHWGQEEKGTTEDEVAGWHHRLDGHEFEWTLGVGDGQEGLACCNSWGLKESDTIEQMKWTELISYSLPFILSNLFFHFGYCILQFWLVLFYISSSCLNSHCVHLFFSLVQLAFLY